jgi:drug/metabolite transporter (DMT)-like permease
MPHLLFFLTSFIWGSSFILMKRASDVFGPMTIGGIRTVGALLFLLVIMRFKKVSFVNFREYGWKLLLIAMLGNVIPFSIQPFLINYYGSGFIGMMVGLVPIFTIIISRMMFKTVIHKFEVWGVIMGLICIIGIFSDGLKRSFTITHLLIAIIVPLGYAITNSFTKHHLTHLNPMALMASQLVFAIFCLNPIAFSTESINYEGDMQTAVISVLILSFIGTGLAGYMFFKMIKMKGAIYVSLVTYVIPIYALFIGWLDGEKVTLIQMLSIIGIILSIFLSQMKGLKRKLV